MEREDQAEQINLELFKMKRQACKLRDELAKKKFAELAMSVKLKETEEEVGFHIHIVFIYLFINLFRFVCLYSYISI